MISNIINFLLLYINESHDILVYATTNSPPNDEEKYFVVFVVVTNPSWSSSGVPAPRVREHPGSRRKEEGLPQPPPW
ncbi:hypothetical protein CDAR_503521 [Caerostris darwini]|uniref:Uncharacterized protein n=1 Tax=Caerostris darwini TaxID=1538125 RepID=A0AAV4S4T2_9ARAC|nr:hypothetical protein CDAR_503521 [Caerostris darwini]